MNQDTWSQLSAKLSERDELQARLDQLNTEVEQLASSVEQELARVRQTRPSPTEPAEPATE